MKTKNRLQQMLSAIALIFRSLKIIVLRATALSTSLAGSLKMTDVVEKENNFHKTIKSELIMIDGLQYNKIATILSDKKEHISIEKLSVISGLSIKELKDILNYFNSFQLLRYGDDYNKILLTEKARK